MVNPKLVETKPEDAGVDAEALEAVFARAKRDVDEGILPSAQVAVARNGKLAGMRTFGEAMQGGELRPATDDTLYCIFSCTKVVVASAVWLLFEEGLLRLDEKVADIIPEFGTNGKENVTVEQVMLHTGGFPLAPFAQDEWGDREKLLEAFSRWRLNWEPDTNWQYHATSAHWVLSEIIYRRTGIDYKTFIRERITEPMGLDELFVGLPEEQGRFAEVGWVGEPVEPPGGWGEVTPEAILGFNDAEGASGGRPRRRRRHERGDDGAVLPDADQRRRGGGRHARAEAGDDRVCDEGADEGPPPRPGLRQSGEPRPQRRHRRRRWERPHARLRPDGLAAGVRARRRGRPDRLGRPGDGHLRGLLHERLHRLHDDGAAHHGDLEPGGELRAADRQALRCTKQPARSPGSCSAATSAASKLRPPGSRRSSRSTELGRFVEIAEDVACVLDEVGDDAFVAV